MGIGIGTYKEVRGTIQMRRTLKSSMYKMKEFKEVNTAEGDKYVFHDSCASNVLFFFACILRVIYLFRYRCTFVLSRIWQTSYPNI